MARLKDNTLLARMGFQDPDAGSTRHDRACQFLAREEDGLLIADCVFKEFRGEHEFYSGDIEKPLTKGEGQYKQTIGFIDVFFEGSLHPQKGKIKECDLVIEVKIHQESIGNILKQINLYAEYLPQPHRMVLVTAFKLTAIDVESLGRARVKHMLLGSRFEAFCKSLAPHDSPEL